MALLKNGNFTKKCSISFFIGFVGILILAANWNSIAGVLSNSTCAQNCHFMAPEYKTWKKSSHSQLSCYSCHLEDFKFGFYNIGPGRVWRSLKNTFKKPINADSAYSQVKISSDRCTKCHAYLNRVLTPHEGSKMSKEVKAKHIDAGLTCTTCHNRIAHKGAGKLKPISTWKPGFEYKDYSKMKDGCWRCHSNSKAYRDDKLIKKMNGRQLKTACRTCHTQYFLKRTVDKSCKKNCHDDKFLKKQLMKTDV